MKFRLFFPLILLFLCCTGYVCAETTIKAEVDKKVITTDENLTYKVMITSSATILPPPVLPKFEGFTALSSAQSSTMSLQQGSVKSFVVYAVILAPLKAGTFKIAPAALKIKKETFSTESIEIEVKEGQRKPAQPPSQQEPQQSFPEPESQEPQYTL